MYSPCPVRAAKITLPPAARNVHGYAPLGLGTLGGSYQRVGGEAQAFELVEFLVLVLDVDRHVRVDALTAPAGTRVQNATSWPRPTATKSHDGFCGHRLSV